MNRFDDFEGMYSMPTTFSMLMMLLRAEGRPAANPLMSQLISMVELAMVAEARPRAIAAATDAPMQNKHLLLLKKYNKTLEKEQDHFCSAITMEVMENPVIDPTTLNAQALVWLSAPAAEKSTLSRGNFDDVPRYDRKTLERLIGVDGKGKSPATRREFTAIQLIPDEKLKAEIDLFMQPFIEEESKEQGKQEIHHIVGDLFFKIVKLEKAFLYGETHRFILVAHGDEIPKTSIALESAKIELIMSNFQNIVELKKIFSEVLRGQTASEILRYIIRFEECAVVVQSRAAASSTTMADTGLQLVLRR